MLIAPKEYAVSLAFLVALAAIVFTGNSRRRRVPQNASQRRQLGALRLAIWRRRRGLATAEGLFTVLPGESLQTREKHPERSSAREIANARPVIRSSVTVKKIAYNKRPNASRNSALGHGINAPINWPSGFTTPLCRSRQLPRTTIEVRERMTCSRERLSAFHPTRAFAAER
jgi:hypothetical protein